MSLCRNYPHNPKVAGSNPAPATMDDEGLADARAANPFRLPRLHPGIVCVWRLLRRLYDARDRNLVGHHHNRVTSAGFVLGSTARRAARARRAAQRRSSNDSDCRAPGMVGSERVDRFKTGRLASQWRGALRAPLTVTVRAQLILLNRITTMRPARAIVAAALSVFTVACAEPPKRANPVGLSFAAYEDTARRSWTRPQDRPLATAVWYPQRWEAANLNGGSASSTPGGTHKRHRCPPRPPNVP